MVPNIVKVDPNVRTPLISIEGKGMIYGGFIALESEESQSESRPELWVDGVYVANDNFVSLKLWGVEKPFNFTLVLAKYDDVAFVYCVEIGCVITFEKSVELVYYERHDKRPNVVARLCYALV